MNHVRALCLLAILQSACGGEGSSASVSAADASMGANEDATEGMVDAISDEAQQGDSALEADSTADVDQGPWGAAILVTIPLDGEPMLSVRMDGNPDHSIVVDTGAIRTMVDETLVRELKNGVGKVSLGVGTMTFPDYEVLAGDLSEAENHIGVRLDGLMGRDLFAQMFLAVDYRASVGYVTAAMPSTPPPSADVLSRVEVPYEEIQGYPVVDAQVGTSVVRLIADTGSGVTLLTQSNVSSTLVEQGLQGYTWYTSYGSDPATIVRLPSLRLQGSEVVGSWAVVIPDNHHLKAVFDALGIDVDGFVGYPVFRNFVVGVSGKDQRFQLYPYATPDVAAGQEWKRVGIEVARQGSDVVVDMVFSPSDAALQDVQKGDIIESIGATSVGGQGLDDIRRKLRGAVGQELTLRLRRQGSAVDKVIKVDDLLP